jgi:glycosyltransferase involved in cell wall biosynthesis
MTDDPTFYQSQYRAWAYSTLENEADMYTLPLGAKFQTIHAPLNGSTNDWIRTLLRVDVHFDPISKKQVRGFISEYSERYTECPVADEFIVFSERIAIVGSRDYPRLADVAAYVNRLPMNAVIVSGGAKGVDSAAENAAKARRMKVVVYLPDWDTHGKAAGFIRNREIVNACDRLVAFSHNESRGTANSVKLAMDAGKPVIVYDSTGAIAA